jgi:hypothetical protein
MGARNQVGKRLSYLPASLCSLATQFQTRFLELIPRPMEGLKFSTRVCLLLPVSVYQVLYSQLYTWTYWTNDDLVSVWPPVN